MSDFTALSASTAYATLLGQISGRDADLAMMLDPANCTPTNVLTNSIRWNSANNRFEKYNGSTWSMWSATMAVTALTASSAVTSNANGVGLLISPASGANPAYQQMNNSGGALLIGMDSSTASLFGTAGNYGSVIYRAAATGFAISRATSVDLAISSSGTVSIPGPLAVGPGGTGTNSNAVSIDGGSGTGGGGYFVGKRNSVIKWYLGHESALIGNTSDDMALYSNTPSIKFYTNGSGTVGVTLGVAGAISTPGTITTTGVVMEVVPATTTSQAYFRVQNAGGVSYFGLDNSAGSAFGTAGAYGTVLYRPVSTSLAISRGGSIDLLIGPTGNVSVGTNISAAGDVQSSSQNNGQLAGFRNRLINGDFRIDQRNAGVAVTPATGDYTVDRWKVSLSAASKLTFQQDTADVPAGFTYALKVSVATQYSPAASDVMALIQPIEGQNIADLQMGLAGAVSVTLSFWVKGSVAGTYGLALRGSQGAVSAYPVGFSVTTSWARQTITIPLVATGGAILLTNVAGLSLYIDLGCGTSLKNTGSTWYSGTTYYAPTGSTIFVNQTAGSTLRFAGIQLEVGPVATPFEQRSVEAELSLCKRYYQQIGGATNSWGIMGYASTASGGYGQTIVLPTTMRATPTGAFVGSTSNINITSLTMGALTPNGTMLFANTTSVGVFQALANGASNLMTFSAEL